MVGELGDLTSEPAPTAGTVQADQGQRQQRRHDHEELQHLVVDGCRQTANRDVGEHDDGRDDQRDDQWPPQQPVDDLAQQEQVDTGDQQLRQREAQRVDQVSRGAVTLEHELGHRADLRAVVERHHHDAQEEHRRDGADPEVVEGRHPVLGAVGRHAHDLDSTQVGRDERDTGDPSGQ